MARPRQEDEFYYIGVDQPEEIKEEIDISDKSKLAEEALKLEDSDIVLEAVKVINDETFLKNIIEKLLKKHLSKKYIIFTEAIKKIHDQLFLQKVIKYYGFNWPELKHIIPNIKSVKILKQIALNTKDEKICGACLENLTSDTDFLYSIISLETPLKVEDPNGLVFRWIAEMMPEDFSRGFLVKEIPNVGKNIKLLNPIEKVLHQRFDGDAYVYKFLLPLIPELKLGSDADIQDKFDMFSWKMIEKIDDKNYLFDLFNWSDKHENNIADIVKVNALLRCQEIDPADQDVNKAILEQKGFVDSETIARAITNITDEEYLLKNIVYCSTRYKGVFRRLALGKIPLENKSFEFLFNLLDFDEEYAPIVLPYIEDTKFVVDYLIKHMGRFETDAENIENDDVFKFLLLKHPEQNKCRPMCLDEIKDKEWVEKIKKRGWAKQGGKLIKEDVKVEEDVEKVVHHKKQLLRLLLPLAV